MLAELINLSMRISRPGDVFVSLFKLLRLRILLTLQVLGNFLRLANNQK